MLMLQGNLEIYGLAMDRIPHEWREDVRWRSAVGGGSAETPAYKVLILAMKHNNHTVGHIARACDR